MCETSHRHDIKIRVEQNPPRATHTRHEQYPTNIFLAAAIAALFIFFIEIRWLQIALSCAYRYSYGNHNSPCLNYFIGFFTLLSPIHILSRLFSNPALLSPTLSLSRSPSSPAAPCSRSAARCAPSRCRRARATPSPSRATRRTARDQRLEIRD